ncbi:MAG: protein-tyrosine-phosphatase [Planctomycetota bacterium]
MTGPLRPARTTASIEAYVAARKAEAIDAERLRTLDRLASTIADALDERGAVDLVFICTHNSRRSQLSEVWAQVAADAAGVGGVRTFSGGTEATAFNPRAVAALRRTGLTVEAQTEGANPRYEVSGGGLRNPHDCWSKTFGDVANPSSDFVAVMTCSDADEACPVVAGASARVALTYVDPKVSDGTDAEEETYDARCAQIACELFHVFDEVAALRR